LQSTPRCPPRSNLFAGKQKILCLQGRNTGKTLFTTGGGSLETDGKAQPSKAPRNQLDRKEAGMMKRVLIIDDDAAIRLLYEEELSEEVTISSPVMARKVFFSSSPQRDRSHPFGCQLRSRSGLSLLRDIRNAFHGFRDTDNSLSCFPIDPKSPSADAYVTKNSDLTGLKQQIEKCLATPGPPEEGESSRGGTPKQQSWNLRCSWACVSTSDRKGLVPRGKSR